MLVGSYHYALPIAISSLITSLDNEVREKALCGAVQRRNLQVGVLLPAPKLGED